MALLWFAGLAVLAYSFISAAEEAQGAPDVMRMEVATPTDMQIFIEALQCNETAGIFDITWYGQNQIRETIDVSGKKNVTIAGVLDTLPTAANDAGIDTGMFFVHGGSTLSLVNLVLDGGLSREGAAVYVIDKSFVNLLDCAFNNNNADNGGAIYARDSEVNIDGETSFFNNSATGDVGFTSGGGAIYATENSTVNIDGNTRFIDNFAVLDGGAMLLADGSEVYTNGTTDFFNNQAGDVGGAIATRADASIHVEGRTTFANNTAGVNGGERGCVVLPTYTATQ